LAIGRSLASARSCNEPRSSAAGIVVRYNQGVRSNAVPPPLCKPNLYSVFSVAAEAPLWGTMLATVSTPAISN
jgi:hypothetical protein